MNQLFRLIAWVVVPFFALCFALNAVYMLFSPSAWFDLPHWLRASGTLTKRRYGQGIGAFQVRICGALMLGMLGWVVYDLLNG
jgi:hypothetical protein